MQSFRFILILLAVVAPHLVIVLMTHGKSDIKLAESFDASNMSYLPSLNPSDNIRVSYTKYWLFIYIGYSQLLGLLLIRLRWRCRVTPTVREDTPKSESSSGEHPNTDVYAIYGSCAHVLYDLCHHLFFGWCCANDEKRSNLY